VNFAHFNAVPTRFGRGGTAGLRNFGPALP